MKNFGKFLVVVMASSLMGVSVFADPSGTIITNTGQSPSRTIITNTNTGEKQLPSCAGRSNRPLSPVTNSSTQVQGTEKRPAVSAPGN